MMAALLAPAWSRWRAAAFACAALVLLGVFSRSRPAVAGSFSFTVQPDSTVTSDSYLREDKPYEREGNKLDLRLKASSDNSNRHPIVDIPFSLPAGRTILQAWLRLTQTASSSSDAVDARIYPLLESWAEAQVTWPKRNNTLQWTTAGGTHGPYWSGRALVSDATVGSEVSWQIGPILAAAQVGTLSPYGFLIQADRGDGAREMAFRASETDVATERPRLVIYYTDEPPAVRGGWAEIQPRAVQSGAEGTPLTLWLDVDAAGTTPSGVATGFDSFTIGHGGAFAVTGLDTFTVGGVPVPAGQVSWSNDAYSATFHFPRIQAQARVEVGFRATILSPAQGIGVALPVTVDDSNTPGCWAQALWPGNADGAAGNGDDWVLVITPQQSTTIEIVPDTVRVVERTCAPVSLFAQDPLDNRFPVQADSFEVLPPSLGTITQQGLFCGTTPGLGRLVAFSGSLTDTAVVVVTPALPPQFSALTLRDLEAAPVTALAPGDTMLLDVDVSDGDGFLDVRRLDFDLDYAGHAGDAGAPAFHAGFRWTRGAVPSWTLVDPGASSWSVLPALCAVDSVTNGTTPQTVRLAFTVGRIARASDAGDWTATVRAYSLTPPDSASASRAGIDCLPRIVLASPDTAGAFSWGQAGATSLPLMSPTDGDIDFMVEANAPWNLEAAASDMAGLSSPTDTLFVRAPTQRVSWALDVGGGYGGRLDTTLAALASDQAPVAAEAPIEGSLHLWLDHPAGLPVQAYRGDLRARVSAAAFGVETGVVRMPLTATVVAGGLAAKSALAEVAPHVAQAGAAGQAFDAYLLPQIDGGDTGINRVIVDLPDGYGATAVSQLEVGGVPASFSDHSVPGRAEVILASRLTSPALLRLRLLADVPTALDTAGSGFVVLYDDTATAIPPQSAVEGNANGQADGNSWIVEVIPGPLASLEVLPAAAVTYVDSTVAFTATGWDAFGHPVTPAVAWSVEGGIGTVVAASGLFTAHSAGNGLVVATSGAVADSAQVTVWPGRAIAVRSVRGPATTFQGQSALTLQVHVENLGAVPVVLDTLRLSFGRGAPRDADADFAWTPSPLDPDTLTVGGGATLDFAFAVSDEATTGPLAVNARASGLEVGTGQRLTDAGRTRPSFSRSCPAASPLPRRSRRAACSREKRQSRCSSCAYRISTRRSARWRRSRSAISRAARETRRRWIASWATSRSTWTTATACSRRHRIPCSSRPPRSMARHVSRRSTSRCRQPARCASSWRPTSRSRCAMATRSMSRWERRRTWPSSPPR